MLERSPMSSYEPSLPVPERERWPLAVALVALLAGAGLLGVALSGAFHHGPKLPAPPAVPAVVVVTPAPAPAGATSLANVAAPAPAAAAPVRKPTKAQRAEDVQRFSSNELAHVPASWVSGFYDIYAQAQKTYGVNWLLIASIHKQETAFSTHPTTYRGLNFARCCAGPMQFNVTNGAGGAGSTWERYRDASAAAPRPAKYPHATKKHPSIYDDYDAIMAGASLLRDSGAGRNLDASAWRAAYDYYGHDATGISYASEVVARAIGWGQKSFCVNCATDARLINAAEAAWGIPARNALDAGAAAAAKAKRDKAIAASTKKR
jgi:hypothetical protein